MSNAGETASKTGPRAGGIGEPSGDPTGGEPSGDRGGDPADGILIRDATADDWPVIWRFMRGIIAAGETYCWDRDTDEERARSMWMQQPPGRTVVAVDADGTVVGTAATSPNHGGPAAHVANAGFMVDPDHSRRGVGRALARQVLDQARADGYLAMQFNAVVETNRRAVDLWRSFGFRILATVPDGFRHPSLGFVGLNIMYRPL